MTASLKACLARIYHGSGDVVGAGWLCAPSRVVTCAHVVANALGISAEAETVDSETVVTLDFPLVDPGRRLHATIEYWLPLRTGDTGTLGDDLAGLRVDDEMDPQCSPATTASAMDNWGDPFRALGFPAGGPAGIWATGVIRDRLANGWHQIEDVKQEGYRIEPGFSGTLVWNERLAAAIGMVVATDAHESTKVAFMIPIDLIARSWDVVLIGSAPPPRPLLTRTVASAQQSPMVTKLNAAGASEGIVADAISLRAAAAAYDLERFSSALNERLALLDDVRERLRIQINALTAKHSSQTKPALSIWSDLLESLMQHATAIDAHGIYHRDPHLLLGEICELTDMCVITWADA